MIVAKAMLNNPVPKVTSQNPSSSYTISSISERNTGIMVLLWFIMPAKESTLLYVLCQAHDMWYWVSYQVQYLILGTIWYEQRVVIRIVSKMWYYYRTRVYCISLLIRGMRCAIREVHLITISFQRSVNLNLFQLLNTLSFIKPIPSDDHTIVQWLW